MKPFLNTTLRLNISDETKVAAALDEVAKAHGAEVAVGSYPICQQADGAQVCFTCHVFHIESILVQLLLLLAQLLLTLDGKLSGPIASATELLKQLLPSDSIIGVEENVRSLLRAHSSLALE